MNHEEIIYFSQTHNCLKTFNLFRPNEPTKRWGPSKQDLKEEFNFFMWLHYNRNTQKVLFLHMVSFDKVKLVEISKEGQIVEKAEVDIKNVNLVNQQHDKFLFASNVEDSMVFYIADETEISKFKFEVTSDVTLIELGFQKDDLMFILYNANEDADSGVFLINLKSYNLKNSPTIKEQDDTCTKLCLHGEDDPALQDGQVLIDRIMQAIAVTTTENNLVLHKILLDDAGKYRSIKEDTLPMKDSPTNFSLNKDSLVYCEKDEGDQISIAFYRSTDLRCLYMWLLTNSAAKTVYNPGELMKIVDILV